MNVKSKFAPDDYPVKEPNRQFSNRVWTLNMVARTHLFEAMAEFFHVKKKRPERTESGSPVKPTDQL